ncbi:DNA damage repair protein (Rad9) [Penicillium angulare]|uniref:DNA damage repair protein (Rad9) n=1 Tax=Penicillium angulare TaxID=116970 RepID=A0A9W9GCJ4_9EURO|nr:DNA damage repair protein (Rad9) [Penicillium angulare]
MGHSGKINNALDEQHFVLKSILVEFQETQCFFMIACESVILISLRHNGIFAATNMAVVVADHTLAGIVGAAGIFPNVVGLWTLQRKKMCSAWIFFLSTCTLIAAEVAIYKISDVPSTSDMTKLHGTFPESCGGHPPPMRFCAWHTLETSLVTVDFFKQYVNPYCLILYGITLIIWAWPFAKKLLWSSAFKKFHPHLSQTSDQCRSIYSTTWFKLVRGLAMFLAELSILPFCALYIACFIGRFNLQFVDWNSWGFGQFLALTTWAAVICKWIYWTIFGTESYSETRIAEPYHIVKDGTAEYNSDRESDDDDNKQLFPKARQSAAYEPGRDVESGETGSNTGLLRADNKTIYPEDHERKNDEYDNDIAMARI